jgi:hypothetical protein
MKSMIRRQSPALIIAVIALIAAFGGSALAGGPINKKKAKKIANNVVTKRAPGLSVAHAKTADNATNAANANRVNGIAAAKFDYRAATGAGTTTIGTFDGLVLQADCLAGTDLFATTSVNNANIKSEGQDEGAGTLEDSLDGGNVGETIDLNQSSEASGTVVYNNNSPGNVASGTWGTEDNEFTDCNAWGTVLSG